MHPTRALHQALEPVVSMLFFVPEAHEEFSALGLDAWSGYFCGRAAPMGRVAPAVVASTFYNFAPSVVSSQIRWNVVDPERMLEARERCATRALTRLLAGEDGTLPDTSEATDLMRTAVAACRPEGRTLFAANAGLAWPSEPLAAFWHAGNLLREYRGDGHIAALVMHGVDAVESLVLQVAWLDVKPDFLLGSRAWGEDAYGGARERLRARGFLDADGGITDAGGKFREMIEVETDRLAQAPVDALGPGNLARLLELLQAFGARVIEARGIPRGLLRFGPAPSRPASQPVSQPASQPV